MTVNSFMVLVGYAERDRLLGTHLARCFPPDKSTKGRAKEIAWRGMTAPISFGLSQQQ